MTLSESIELVLLRYRDGYYSDKDNKVKANDGKTAEQRAIQDILNAIMNMIKGVQK